MLSYIENIVNILFEYYQANLRSICSFSKGPGGVSRVQVM